MCLYFTVSHCCTHSAPVLVMPYVIEIHFRTARLFQLEILPPSLWKYHISLSHKWILLTMLSIFIYFWFQIMHKNTWWLHNRTFSVLLRTSPVESEQADWSGHCVTVTACSLHREYEKHVHNSDQETSSEDDSWKFCISMEEKVREGGVCNIKIGLKATGWEGVDQIQWVQSRYQGWVLVNTVMALRVSQTQEISWPAE